MSRASVFITGLMTALLASSLGAWASELDGVQLHTVGNKVQVILNTASDQPYSVSPQKDGSSTITLPKTKLPTAFQMTGLPPIQDQKTGITAHIKQVGEGIRIRLTTPSGQEVPYEVHLRPQVKASTAPVQAKSPLAILDSPPRSHLSSRARVYKETAPRFTRLPITHLKPRHYTAAKPILVVAKLTPKISASKAVSTTPEAKPSVITAPVIAETPKPSVSTPAPVYHFTPKTTYLYKPVSHPNLLTGSMVRWLLVSMVLLGALLFVAIFLGLLVKKKFAPTAAITEEEEFFDPPAAVQSSEEPETYQAYLAKEDARQEAALQQKEIALSAPAVRPSTPKFTDEFLNTPAHSVSDAVKIGLSRKKENPYLTTPFEIAKQSVAIRNESQGQSPQNDIRQKSFQRIISSR